MPIVGIGTDIIEINRIIIMEESIRDRLAKRVLTSEEYQQYCELNEQTNDSNLNKAVYFLAKRWAGKEAAAKALGTGIAQGVSFQHIEIKTLESGQPTLLLTGQALVIAKLKESTNWHISLADEKLYATAFVTLS